MSSSTVGVGADDLVTGEAVALDLPHAGIGLRLASGLLDLLVGYGLLYGLQLAVGFLIGGADDAIQAAVSIAVVIVAWVAVPTTFETLTRGKTLGHLAVGLRTVRDDAGPIGFRHALTRALLGVIELYSCAGVPALICAGVSQRGKRLGDLLAGTYVVRDRHRISLPPPVQMPPHLASWARTADVAPLPDQLAVALRQFVARAATFTPEVREQLGQRLLEETRPYVAPAPPEGNHPEYVLMAVLAERRSRDAARLEREDALRARILPPDPTA
ncbi:MULTISPECIES: RDD family protein [unclassified Phycicoccus]|uniref:RDD family protein n=1 Tax=unclassified Phycicoccus TaxID=2637926 RepID=UPI000703406B|nr:MULTISPECIES: RDD family protein [unclassified Phycicoccus]KQU69313.1 transporter [Phycicoccus sp. Root101]KQZ90516.1 transporter [Phycicoccus sp. Root563]